MLTFEKVLDMFGDYLAKDLEVEIVHTSRGYLRIEWNGTSLYCDGGYVCDTPEELFDKLLDDYKGYLEIELTKGRRDATAEDEHFIVAQCQPFLELRRLEETT
jgi:hypothetical protein